MIKFLLSLCLLVVVAPLCAATPSVQDIVQRARATVGDESALNGLQSLRMRGGLKPADPEAPTATLLIVAREPGSQRLELKRAGWVETTLLNGGQGCVIRTDLNDAARRSQMRGMTEAHRQRMTFSTRQLFNFYTADFKRGERITYAGIEARRGVSCHKLLYAYAQGRVTTRYFAVNDDTLVSTVTDDGVESVELGSQIVGGIKFPQQVEYYRDGNKLHTIVLTKIEVNPPLPPEIFKIPTAKARN